MKLNAREAARLLAMPESELYAKVDDGTIPCHLVNKQPLFSDVELLEWATENGRPLARPLALGGNDHALRDAIAVGGVYHDVPGDAALPVLHAVVERLPIEGDDPAADREMVLALMLAHAAEVSTAVGDGIVIPHVRAPLVFPDRPAAITVCFLSQPIAFALPPKPEPTESSTAKRGGALLKRGWRYVDELSDKVREQLSLSPTKEQVADQPVHTFFAMITPTIHSHLQMLSRLAIALHDPEFRAIVAKRGTRDELVDAAARVDAAASGAGA